MSKKAKAIIIAISIIIVAIIVVCIYFILSSNKKIEELSNELDTYKISNSNENAKSAEIDNENVAVNETIDNNTVNNQNSKNEVNNNTTSKNTTNSNSNDTEYEKANTAIKQALKDEDWLNKNISGWENDKLYFVKINDINSLPAYLIRRDQSVSSDGLDKVRLITYINGNVHVSNNDNFDYVNVTYDPGSNVVRMQEDTEGSREFGTGFVKYYKMKNNGEFECIQEFIFSDADYGIGEKYGDPEEAYLNDVKAYDANYNFTSINIELTNQNVDKYVK